MTMIRNARLAAAFDRAIDGSSTELVELLQQSSGLPGIRPNLDLARTIGASIAALGARGDRLLADFAVAENEYPRIVAAMALVERSLLPVTAGNAGDTKAKKREAARVLEALADLQQIAEDPRHAVRLGVIAAVRVRLHALGEPAVHELAAWTDGYLQAHIALEALSDRSVLDKLPSAEPVMARLEEAFALADKSPRAAERSQGMRVLRQGMPAQIAILATRYREMLAWLESKTSSKRPETREVVTGAISALRRSVISDVDANRMTALMDASAKPRRDIDRVVAGTRKRGKGRG